MHKFKKIIRKKTEKELISKFITLLEENIKKKKALNQRFSFVLTGGSSPKKLYRQLSKIKINWNNVDLFLVDERYVKKNSKNLNYNLIRKNFINNIKIDKKNIYPIDISKKSAYFSGLDYEKKIKNYFKKRKKEFDLILLGMGEDGHVASIFPNNINLNNKKLTSIVEREDFDRITLNLNIINKAKKIFLWLNDKNKSNIYKHLKKKSEIPVNYLNKNRTYLFARS
jgi:6-phosphogluconolactonase